MFNKENVARVVAEFLGTGVLTLVVLSVFTKTSFAFFTAAGAGLAVVLAGLIFGKLTPGYFNPAVTLGLWTRRLLPTYDAIALIAAQFLGAVCAFSLYQYLVNQTIDTGTQPFEWRVLVAETVGAIILGIGIISALTSKLLNSQVASTVGISVFIGMVVASIASSGLINPALALGVDSFSKAYVVGPLLGVVVGMNLYGWLFSSALRKKSKNKVFFLARLFR